MDRQPNVLAAYSDPQGKMHAWCDHCKEWHVHSRGAGKKTAACTDPKSPYRRTGYTLRYAGQFTPEIAAQHTAEG